MELYEIHSIPIAKNNGKFIQQTDRYAAYIQICNRYGIKPDNAVLSKIISATDIWTELLLALYIHS